MNWVLLLFLFIALALFFVRDKMKFPGKGSVPGMILYGIFGGLILLSLSRSVREGYANIVANDFTFDSKVLDQAPVPRHLDYGEPLQILFMTAQTPDRPDRTVISFTRDEYQRCMALGGESGYQRVRDPNALYSGVPDRSMAICIAPCPTGKYVVRGNYGTNIGCQTIPKSTFTSDQREKCLNQNGDIVPITSEETVITGYDRYGNYSYKVPKIRDTCFEKCPNGSIRIEGGKCKAINAVAKQRDGTCQEGFEEASYNSNLCIPMMQVPRKVLGDSVRGAPGPDGKLMCPDGGYEANEQEGTCAKLGECPTGFAISTENPFVCSFTGNMSSVRVLDRIRSNQEQLGMSPGNTSNVACGGQTGYILDPQNPEYCIKVA